MAKRPAARKTAKKHKKCPVCNKLLLRGGYVPSPRGRSRSRSRKHSR